MTDSGGPEDPEATVARLQRELAEAEAEVRRKSLEAEITELTDKISNLQDKLEEPSKHPAPADSEGEHPNEMSPEASDDESESSEPATDSDQTIQNRKVAAVLVLLAIAIALGITFGNSGDSSNSSNSVTASSKVKSSNQSESSELALTAPNTQTELAQYSAELEEKADKAAPIWARHQVTECEGLIDSLEGQAPDSYLQDLRKNCTFDSYLDDALRDYGKVASWTSICLELKEADLEDSNVSSVTESRWRKMTIGFKPGIKKEIEANATEYGMTKSDQNQAVSELAKIKAKDMLVSATDYLCPQYSVHTSKLEG